MKSILIQQIQQPHTKHVLEVCTTQSAFDEELVSLFSKACEIVDAQFYYTNPLLFVFVDAEDCEEYAQLYDDYFLIPPKLYNTLDLDVEFVAANIRFLENICSLSQIGKTTTRALEAETPVPNPFENLFKLYQDKGLYLIGIRKHVESIK